MRRTCTARRKDGQPCGGAPLRGADKCRMHLGRRTAIVKLEQQARDQLARLDVPPVEDPLTQLAAVTGQVLAWKDAWAAKVNALDSMRYETEGGEQLRAEIAVWERALDRCEKFLTAMARLDIDERLAKITETRATTIIAVFLTALDEGGVEGAQRDAVIRAADQQFARQAGVIL
jgi:hypothetical protein